MCGRAPIRLRSASEIELEGIELDVIVTRYFVDSVPELIMLDRKELQCIHNYRDTV